MVGQVFAGGVTIDVFFGQIDKVLFDKTALGPAARCHWFGQGDGNAVLIAGQNLFTAEVATVGNNIQLVGLESRLGPRCIRRL